jgi:predicted RNase H-like HicB family nuclease
MKAKILTYKTIIEKDGKYFHGYAPSLPGCHTQGKTVEETRKNLKMAIQAWMDANIELGWPIPSGDVIESTETVKLPSNISVNYA